MSGADRWPVNAAALAEAFRRTDAVVLDEAVATTASAALAEEAARYEEEYTAEYGERADLEALYAAAAWARVAAWAAEGAVKAIDGEHGPHTAGSGVARQRAEEVDAVCRNGASEAAPEGLVGRH